MRVSRILAGCEHHNVHDALCSDAVFKLIAGRRSSRHTPCAVSRCHLELRPPTRPSDSAAYWSPRGRHTACACYSTVRRPHARRAATDLLSRLLRPIPVITPCHHLRRKRSGGDGFALVWHGLVLEVLPKPAPLPPGSFLAISSSHRTVLLPAPSARCGPVSKTPSTSWGAHHGSDTFRPALVAHLRSHLRLCEAPLRFANFPPLL